MESYRAVADAARAVEAAAGTLGVAAAASPFTIDVRFTGGLDARQQEAFAAAADRWTRMIVGDLPAVVVDGETIDDVLILASGADIDGSGQILGQAGPTQLRPVSAGLLPAVGQMQFDTADLARMESEGTLDDVITHEMGHVLGIGNLWSRLGLLSGAGAGTADPVFTGTGAVAEWTALGGSGGVPVENTGGPGTRDGHWRESVFGDELMSGFITEAGNPISRVTVASLGDLGYVVDLEASERYRLPAGAEGSAAIVGRPGRRCRVGRPTAHVLPEAALHV
ncbi:leishmanolysin-related zinc metalloendopeptidase [Pseudonocardia halophobica]|uniref:Peptidase n=1 Tax=Pseudonocardia halophobica TaxID=29401 RepID=A0A9W6L3C1_9PSEU|nr:leishmanolysin-related zinc metalloendopeptidase [Pseudonocardia halophobica]GLL12916.1 peptidase [Pseudonocardia halophobica]